MKKNINKMGERMKKE